MRHFQKPIENPNSESSLLAALIECLSPERRRELLEVAAQSRMLEIIVAHQGKTVEAFLRAVQADAHWAILKDLPLSDVITWDSERAVGEKRDADLAPQTAAAGDLRRMHLPSVSTASASAPTNVTPSRHASTAKHKKDAPRKAPPATQKSTGDIVDDVMTAITLEPGLRSEEIQKRLGKSSLLVKSTLAALRKNKRVRTEGANRATRYFPLTGK
jgi:hypothetical protein